MHALDERIGTAQKQHVGAQGVAAREHGKILLDDSLKQRRHQFILRHADLLQSVDVRFREHAALARHRMDFESGVALLAQLLGGDVQLGADLVDHRAGAAGAFVVHGKNLFLAAVLQHFLIDEDFGVLSAQFDHGPGFGMKFFDGHGYGVDFLHELAADVFGKRRAAAAGQKQAAVIRADFEFAFQMLDKLQHLFRLAGVVPLVILPQGFIGSGIHQHRFHRCGTDIDSQ